MSLFILRVRYHYRYYRTQLGWRRLYSLRMAIRAARATARVQRLYKSRLWPR